MATARPKGRGYEIRVSLGYATNGKKITKSHTWIPPKNLTPKQIEKELNRQKILLEEEYKNGKCIHGNIKFQAFSERWLEEYAKKNLAPKTYARYISYLKRINSAIGHIKLEDLKPTHLNYFYKELSKPGISLKTKYNENRKEIGDGRLAPKTVLDHHRVISKILNTAVKWQIINENVARRADPPKVPYREINVLDEQETKKLMLALNQESIQHKTMIMILLLTGIRRGELFGLEWKDIDFKNQTMKIARTSQYVGNRQLITKEPKTHSGIRTLSIGNSLCALLKSYYKWQLQQKLKAISCWGETDRLFTSCDGTPMYPDSLTKWFQNFLKRNNLPKVTLHSLRHTNATLMIAEGTDIRTVSNRLGHAHTSTTLNIYAYALKSKDQEAADKLDCLYDNINIC